MGCDAAVLIVFNGESAQTPRSTRKPHNLNEMDAPLSAAIAEATDALRAERHTRVIHTWDIVRLLEKAA